MNELESNTQGLTGISPGAVRAARRYLVEFFKDSGLPEDLTDLVVAASAKFKDQQSILDKAFRETDEAEHPHIWHALGLINEAIRLSHNPVQFVQYINLNSENLGIARGYIQKYL